MQAARPHPSLGTILRELGRPGCIGFGGPPAHIALLRELCVQRRRWLDGDEFEDAIAANLFRAAHAHRGVGSAVSRLIAAGVGARRRGGRCGRTPGGAIDELSVLGAKIRRRRRPIAVGGMLGVLAHFGIVG